MNKYERRSPFREIRDRVLIVCGGETEKIYFNKLKEQYRGKLTNVDIKIVSSKKYTNPKGVVETALKYVEYDEIWCVFDKDDFTDFDEAIDMTKRYKNVYCAFSNEAIEYWFMLYYSNRTGHIKRNDLNKSLEKQFDIKYDKKVSNIEKVCDKLMLLDIETAEERARYGYEYHKLNSGEKYSQWQSCTTVYMLTKRLREWNDAK